VIEDSFFDTLGLNVAHSVWFQ